MPAGREEQLHSIAHWEAPGVLRYGWGTGRPGSGPTMNFASNLLTGAGTMFVGLVVAASTKAMWRMHSHGKRQHQHRHIEDIFIGHES